MAEVTRVFQPLSGPEIRKLMHKDLDDALDQWAELTESHLVWPVFKYQMVIDCEAYPRDPPELQIKVKGGVQQVSQEKIPVEPRQTAKREWSGEVERKVDSPDEVREELGLDVTVPTRTPFGIVDLPAGGTTVAGEGGRPGLEPGTSAVIDKGPGRI